MSVNATAAHLEVHFGQSKGSYFNGFTLDQTSLPTACILYGSGHPNPGGPGATSIEQNCLFWTEECSRECGTAVDPNAYPSDVSCFCMQTDGLWEGAARAEFATATGFLDPGTTTTLVGGLVTDTDRDGTVDQRMSTIPGVKDNANQQARLTMVENGVARLDWEDILQAPNGDFNDYAAYLELRTCASVPSAVDGEEITINVTCRDTCAHPSNDCDPSDDRIVFDPLPLDDPEQTTANPEMMFAASVTIDPNSGEIDPEPRGRLMHVSVGSYVSPRSSIHQTPTRSLAVCPTIVLDLLSVGQMAPSISTGYYVNDPRGVSEEDCTLNATGGTPICASPGTSRYLRVSLARDQHYDVGCTAGRVGPGDGMLLRPYPESDACGDTDGYVAHYETYELTLAELASAMSSAGIVLPNPLDMMSVVEIGNLVHSISIDVVTGVDPATAFYCPSGLGMDLTTVGNSHLRLQQALIPKAAGPGDDGFNVIVRGN